jgi:two-component system response regulator HydG
MKERVLIIDDDRAIRDGCAQVLIRSGCEVYEAADGAEAMKMMDRLEFDLVLLDLKLPDINGLDLLSKIRSRDSMVPVVMITAYGTIQNAVEAMRMGANDFLPKPFEPDELRLVVNRTLAAKRLALENLYLKEELRRKEGDVRIIGKSPSMERIFQQVARVAPTDSTILITGESGTGKGVLAKYIHEQSPRKEHPFVSVDCSTLVPTLFESELFGHVKGAFTGAESDKIGKFELASGGTLFLDEIGNVNLDQQAKLLKAVEEKEISRVGSHRLTKVDVRIIAATNRDLRRMVERGEFREDLFFRLNVVAIRMPPLREREGDVPELAKYFLEQFGKKYKRTGLKLAPAVLALFSQYRWPGNVRELENTIERLVIFARRQVIDVEDLRLAGVRIVERLEPTARPNLDQAEGGGPGRGPKGPFPLSEVEKAHILSILDYTGGNRSEAARLLGIDRKTLRQKLKRWGIE